MSAVLDVSMLSWVLPAGSHHVDTGKFTKDPSSLWVSGVAGRMTKVKYMRAMDIVQKKMSFPDLLSIPLQSSSLT